jgi:hypothetical protein
VASVGKARVYRLVGVMRPAGAGIRRATDPYARRTLCHTPTLLRIQHSVSTRRKTFRVQPS